MFQQLFAEENLLNGVSANEIRAMEPEDEEKLHEAAEEALMKVLLANSSVNVSAEPSGSLMNLHNPNSEMVYQESSVELPQLHNEENSESEDFDEFEENFDEPEFEYSKNRVEPKEV